MARTRTFDDAKVVRDARDVFWERGFGPTSLAELQEATGLSRSSLYAAYGSKRGLFERAVTSYLAEVVDPLLGPMEEPGAGAAEISGFFLAMAAVLRDPDERMARRGCLILNTALEVDELDAEMVDLVARYRVRVLQALRNALATADDVTARAEVLTVGHVGVMTTARIAPRAAALASETIAADVHP